MRIDIDLGERYRSIVSFTGLISSLCGLIMLTPLIVLGWHPVELRDAHGFFVPGLSLAISGFLV